MARTIRIGFLGNCFILGYPGVAARDTFPEIARRMSAAGPLATGHAHASAILATHNL